MYSYNKIELSYIKLLTQLDIYFQAFEMSEEKDTKQANKKQWTKIKNQPYKCRSSTEKFSSRILSQEIKVNIESTD